MQGEPGPRKKQKLEQEGSGDHEGQEDPLLKEASAIQDELDKLDTEENEKVLELTKQFNARKKPHIQKRTEALQKIPNFWHRTFLHHDLLAGLLTEQDEDVLRYLSSLEVEEAEDVKSGFKITLTFNKNPYFSNSTLWKQYSINEAGDMKITASTIEWKGKDPTKPKGGKGGEKSNKRSYADSDEEEPSFFCWFAETEEGGVDEVAEVIKDEIWTSPLRFYQIVEVEGDDDDDEGGADEGEGEGEGEDEEDEEDGE
jgi:template-activating factor I